MTTIKDQNCTQNIKDVVNDKCKVDMIIYHNWCPDGIAGAWPFWRENKQTYINKEVKILGYTYGQNPPDVKDKNVVIVDFSFPRAQLLEMALQAKSILILDHHKSAQRDLENIDKDASNIMCIFDMERSGAQIAWDYVYVGQERPWFIEVIADRDLWKWKIPYSKYVSKAMSIKNYYTWENLENLYQIKDPKEIETVIGNLEKIGQIFIEQEDKEISIICSKAVITEFTTPQKEKYRVKLVSCGSNLRSDVGNRLAGDDCDFAAMWTYDFILDEWWVSLRANTNNSMDDKNIDLSKICEQFYRGGGHPKAAGFTILGSKGERLQTYFRILEMPKSRKYIEGDKF